jgi:Spy/CpxP family protein refolding chaperone
MRRHCKLIAAVAIALLLGAPALAQVRGGFSSVGLARSASVQKELKLTDEQAEKLNSALKDHLNNVRDSLPGKDATPEQGAKFMKKMADDFNKALAGVLKPEQLKRFKQIELQQIGLRDQNAQKELKLSDEQITKIREIADKARAERKKIREDTQSNLDEVRDKSAKLRKETREKELAVLSDAQKTQWQEMIGEPFEVKDEPRAKDQN